MNQIFIILNKPKGFVCALKDNLHPTVISLIKEKVKNIHIVGRLDKDTTGLLVLTNDGQYTHNATHPKKHVKKVYEVTLKKDISEADIKVIEQGMKIDHGSTQLKPAKVKIINNRKVYLEITEGKFHQVKKMFFALENEVLELHRTEFDNFKLSDINIKTGEYKIIENIPK